MKLNLYLGEDLAGTSESCEIPITVCDHTDICVVKETPSDGKYMQQPKTYVKCNFCNEILPIKRITYEERITDIIPDSDKKLSEFNESYTHLWKES